MAVDMGADHFAGRTVRTWTAGTHSCVLAPHLKGPLGRNLEGKYGRMFPDLPTNKTGDAALTALGRAGSIMDEAGEATAGDRHADNPRIPAGFTFLGQL